MEKELSPKNLETEFEALKSELVGLIRSGHERILGDGFKVNVVLGTKTKMDLGLALTSDGKWKMWDADEYYSGECPAPLSILSWYGMMIDADYVQFAMNSLILGEPDFETKRREYLMNKKDGYFSELRKTVNQALSAGGHSQENKSSVIISNF